MVNLVHLLEKTAALLVIQLVIIHIQLKSGIGPCVCGGLGAVRIHNDVHILGALIGPCRKGHLAVSVGDAEHRHHGILHRHIIIIGEAVIGLRCIVLAVYIALIGIEYGGIVHKPDEASAAVRHKHISGHPIAVLLFPLQRLRVHHIHASAAGPQKRRDIDGRQTVQALSLHFPAGNVVVYAFLPQSDIYLHPDLRLPKPDIQTVPSLLHLAQRGFRVLLGCRGNILYLVAVIVLQCDQGVCDAHIGAV